MSTDTLRTEYGRLSLGALADLPIADDFKRAVDDLYRDFDCDDLTRGREVVKGVITLQVSVEFVPEHGTGSVTTEVKVKRPSPRSVKRSTLVRNGTIYVEQEDDHRQMHLVELNRPHRDERNNRGA